MLTTLSRLSVAKTKSDLSLVDKVPNAAKIKVTTVEGEGVELIEVAVVYVYRYYFIYCFVCLLIFFGGGGGEGGRWGYVRYSNSARTKLPAPPRIFLSVPMLLRVSVLDRLWLIPNVSSARF